MVRLHRIALSSIERICDSDFYTGNGTAMDGWDFYGASGTLTFAPGETSQTIWVEVLGDFDYEGDEQFYVYLTNVLSNATIQGDLGVGTIMDNDYWW